MTGNVLNSGMLAEIRELFIPDSRKLFLFLNPNAGEVGEEAVGLGALKGFFTVFSISNNILRRLFLYHKYQELPLSIGLCGKATNDGSWASAVSSFLS